ncbi:hypothetical protein BOX15_Mlig030271g6 [Macrostomum lignano]|uniref:Uncharacterized protein n=1 Tax=Macrostomum lignano TaxID=282301 RepID=A0A267DFM1_9PLAT|nr:hypothetical protein BOX15_Mlig030271g6 [Macrostomum lignano]
MVRVRVSNDRFDNNNGGNKDRRSLERTYLMQARALIQAQKEAAAANASAAAAGARLRLRFAR